MNRRSKWVILFGICVLCISLWFNWSTERTIHGFAANAQGNLMQGEGFISQADNLLAHGDKSHAGLFAYEGLGYLFASTGGMEQMGIRRVGGLSMYLNSAIYSLLGYTNAGQQPDSVAIEHHYQKVIQVFITSFKPFGHTNFGSISNHELQHAIDLVFQAMTPQEKDQFQGWG